MRVRTMPRQRERRMPSLSIHCFLVDSSQMLSSCDVWFLFLVSRDSLPYSTQKPNRLGHFAFAIFPLRHHVHKLAYTSLDRSCNILNVGWEADSYENVAVKLVKTFSSLSLTLRLKCFR